MYLCNFPFCFQFHLLKLDHYDFFIPESDTIEVFAEITSASGFEYDNLFIRYYLNLPNGKMLNNILTLLVGCKLFCFSTILLYKKKKNYLYLG